MANNVAASMTASIVIDKNNIVVQALKELSKAQKELNDNKLEIFFDVSDENIRKKLKEIQKQLRSEDYVVKIQNQGVEEVCKNLDELIGKVKDIVSGKAFGSGNGKGIGNSIVDEKSLNNIIDLFTKMESHLSSIKTVFSDVGDGEEFSPLLKMINNVQTAIYGLSSSVKGIGLNMNMNIDVGSNSEMEAKVQSKVSNALQAYQRLFDSIKMSGIGGSIINQKFFDFDINQYDTMMGKLQAYKKFIDNMRNEAKAQYNGKDVLYQSVDKSYWTQASSAMGQVTKAFNEMNAVSDTNPLKDLFCSGDLSEVVSQLDKIVIKLEEISTTVSSFKNVFDNGFNVTASVEEIDKLTNRVKELEDELSKIKLNPVSMDKSTNDIKEVGESVDEVKKSLDDIVFKPNTEGFDEIVTKLNITKDKINEINKIIKNSIWSESQGKYLESYNIRYKNGTSETRGESSHNNGSNVLKASEVAYDAKAVEKANKQKLKSEQDLQKQKDAFHKKNISAIDLEIQKRKEESKMVSSALKSQMEVREKQLSSMESSLKSYQDKLFDMSAKSENMNMLPEYKTHIESLNQAVSEYESFIKSLQGKGIIDESDIDKSNELTSNIEKLLKKTKTFSSGDKGFTDIGADKVLEKINNILKQNSKMSKLAKDQITAYYNEIRSGNPTKPLNEILDAVYKIVQAEREAGRAGKSFLEIFKEKVIYGGAAQLAGMFGFYDVINMFREGFSTIKELDTALVDLKKTTAMNSSQLEEFYFDSNDVAKQMGVTTQAIIDQASAWSRLGFNTKETSTKMAKLSSQFATISPGMDTDTAQEGLISIMKAWNIDVNDVKSEIMDNINALGNGMAENNQDIVEGMERSAAALASVGTSYEDAFAMFSGIQEVLQNAEVSGRALRSISMRIRGYDESTEELSSDLANITGELIDLTKTAEHSQGVSIFKDGSTTEFKSLVDYFGEINEVWDEMSQKQQNDFLQKAFGKTQAQAGAALIQNYQGVTKSLEIMENAAGSADREMATVEQSLEFKLNALKQTWVGTIQNLVDRGDIGAIIDAFTSLSEAIGWVIDNLGILGTTALIGGGILGGKNAGKCA